MTTRRCFRCDKVTREYCGVSGLAFCSAEHRSQHWDENPWLYALQGKQDEKERKKLKEELKKKKRTRKPGDKASLVALAVSQMPEGTMSEREAIHLHELKTRFDNARDAHRKALKRESLQPSDDPEIEAIRASAAQSRLDEMRQRRSDVLDEYERLGQKLLEAREEARRREEQARLGYEYVLQEQVRFEDRSGEEQFEAWQPRGVTTTVTVKPGDNSNARQVVIEVEEPPTTATTASSSTITADETSTSDETPEMDVMPPVVTSDESESEFEYYDALVLYPDATYSLRRFDAGYEDDDSQRRATPGQRLIGRLYVRDGDEESDTLSRWGSFVREQYGYEPINGLRGFVYIYPPQRERRFTRDELQTLLNAVSREGREYDRAHAVVRLHMDGSYDTYPIDDDDIDGSDWPLEEWLKNDHWQLLCGRTGQRLHASDGLTPWSTFLYERLRWEGAVYNATLILVERDAYGRMVNVTENEQFVRQLANASKELVKRYMPPKK